VKQKVSDACMGAGPLNGFTAEKKEKENWYRKSRLALFGQHLRRTGQHYQSGAGSQGNCRH